MELFFESFKEAAQLFATGDATFFGIVLKSFQVSGLAVVLGLLIGVPFGVLLGLARFPGRGLLAVFTNTGMAVPPVAIGLFVYMLLSRQGPLGSLGWLFSVPAMVIAQVLLATPYIAAITMAAIASVPRELRLQAAGLGATRLQSVWLVVREARVSLMVAVIAGFGAVISEVGAVMMVGGNITTSEGNVTAVMTTSIVEETRKGNYALAMALALFLLFFAVLPLNLLLTTIQRGYRGRWLQS